MAYTGCLPSASIHGTWLDNIEFWSADDNELMDFSEADEIELKLRDPCTGYDELVLTLTDGSITLPSTGQIQWRAEVEHMAMLSTKLYEVLLIFYVDDDTIPVVIGNISIVE